MKRETSLIIWITGLRRLCTPNKFSSISMQKEAFEPTGLIPRSIIRTFDRFLQQLLPGSESIALQEYRISRYQILVSIQSLLILVCLPLCVNYIITSFLFIPLTEHFWNSQQTEIFLNAYQEKRAFAEMQDFSEKIFFESLLGKQQENSQIDSAHLGPFERLQVKNNVRDVCYQFNDVQKISFIPSIPHNTRYQSLPAFDETCTPQKKRKSGKEAFEMTSNSFHAHFPKQEQTHVLTSDLHNCKNFKESSFPFLEYVSCDGTEKQLEKQEKQEEYILQEMFQLKSLEIATRYNQQSILAITHLCADLVTLGTLYVLSMFMKAQIIILKSFVIESIYSLSDTTKSFLLILGMDLLVGFHSPRAWEIALETCIRHFGLPENENFILLFVALFPVFLDTVFKYWIFRYLNKISPSTVVTYHSMLE